MKMTERRRRHTFCLLAGIARLLGGGSRQKFDLKVSLVWCAIFSTLFCSYTRETFHIYEYNDDDDDFDVVKRGSRGAMRKSWNVFEMFVVLEMI